MQRHRGADQACRLEVGGGALERHGPVLGRVVVGGTEQDDRLADLLALTQDIHHVVRGAVGAELVAEDVDAGAATRRRGRGRGPRTERSGHADAADQSQRRRAGEELALNGHVKSSSRGTTAVPCARLVY